MADAHIKQLKRLVEAEAQTFSRDTDIVNVFCLTCSYARCDELIWVKTNQLQRLIRTGRTGHWLNHGKEHCLVRWCFWFMSVVDILVWSKNCFFVCLIPSIQFIIWFQIPILSIFRLEGIRKLIAFVYNW